MQFTKYTLGLSPETLTGITVMGIASDSRR